MKLDMDEILEVLNYRDKLIDILREYDEHLPVMSKVEHYLYRELNYKKLDSIDNVLRNNKVLLNEYKKDIIDGTDR